MQPQLVLASASPRRQDLLRQVGLSFVVRPATIDEDAVARRLPAGSGPAAIAMLTAQAKAEAVAADPAHAAAVVLGADTVVALGDEVFGKPADADEAVDMLRRLSGRTHTVYTGVCLVQAAARKLAVAAEATGVTMHTLTDKQIRAYVSSGEPLDKAGAYGIQGLGAVLVERIEGCYFNVVGLPLPRLCRMLEDFSISVWG